MLFRVRWIECMMSGSEDRVARHMLPPVVKGHAPWIRAGVSTERGKTMQFRFPGEPAAVLLSNRAIRRFDLRVMKDRFTEDEVAVGSPCEVMQGMMGVLATEPGQDGLAMVRLAIPVGILEKSHVRLLGNVDSTVAELEGKGYVQVVRPNGRLVGLAVTVQILEDNDLVVWRSPRINVRISGGTTHPHATLGIPTHLNRASNVGKIFLAGKQGDFEARVHLECLTLLLGRHPLVGSATRLGLGHFRNVRVVDQGRNLLAGGQCMDALIAVRSHDVEVSHRGKKVQVAIASVAPTRVIKCVKRTVAKEVLAILLYHGSPHLLVQLGSLLAKELSENGGGEQLVTLLIEVSPVHGEVVAGRSHRLLGSCEGIHETDFLLNRHFLHDLEVCLDVAVVAIRRSDALHVFVGDGRNEDYPRRRLTIEGFGLDVLQVFRQAFAEGRQPFPAGEGLVVAESSQHYVGFHSGKVLVRIGEVCRAGLKVHLVRCPRKVSKHQFIFRMSLLQQRLQVPEFMHPVEQGVANQPYTNSLLQLERQLSIDRIGGFRPLGRFRKHGIPVKFRVLSKT